MTDFKIHFFKENKRVNIESDLDLLIKTDNYFKNFSFEKRREQGVIIYRIIDENLPYPSHLELSEISSISSDRLLFINPKYLDINFRLVFPFSTPNYFAAKLFKFIGYLSFKLGLVVYTEFFQDCRAFDQQYLETLYAQIKEKFKLRRFHELKDYYLASSKKLNAILSYLEQKEDLKDFYKDQNVCVPNYQYIIDNQNRFCLAINWDYQSQILFPPYTDYTFFQKGNDLKIIIQEELLEALQNLIEPVPGYSQDAKILKKDKLKKALKIISKTNFTEVKPEFKATQITYLTD